MRICLRKQKKFEIEMLKKDIKVLKKNIKVFGESEIKAPLKLRRGFSYSLLFGHRLFLIEPWEIKYINYSRHYLDFYLLQERVLPESKNFAILISFRSLMVLQ